jgi:membrane protein implicated in regulation of membrane protease activity
VTLEMWRSVLGYASLVVAVLLLGAEMLSVLARLGMFAGASEVVPVRLWRWADAWRVLGAVGLSALGYWLLRHARGRRDRAA